MAIQERGWADTLTITGCYAEAEEHYTIAIRELERLRPGSHIVATAYTRCALMLHLAGRGDEAEPLARCGYEMGFQMPSAPGDQRWAYTFVLGRILQDRGKAAEAAPLLYQSLQFVYPGPREQTMSQTCNRIALLHLHEGNVVGALLWRLLPAMVPPKYSRGHPPGLAK
jgi:hypothetical protein